MGAEIKVGDSRGSWTSGDAEVKGICCDGLFGKMGNQLPVILIAFYSELNSVLLKFTSTRNLRMRPCLEIGSLLMSLVKDLKMKPSWI